MRRAREVTDSATEPPAPSRIHEQIRMLARRVTMRALEGNSSMKCTVNWQGSEGMAFVAETGSGHLAAMDGAPEGGGRNLAPRPMEMLLVGAGGCTAYDVVLILKKGRHKVTGCSVQLTAERAETHPRVFTRIHFHFRVSGHQLSPEAVERAIALSSEKYCSATIMLGKSAQISHDFELVESGNLSGD
jgi:putative redox protein